MAKASKTKSSKTFDKTIRKPLRNDEPVHIPLSFEDAVKLALNTDLSKKSNKKG